MRLRYLPVFLLLFGLNSSDAATILLRKIHVGLSGVGMTEERLMRVRMDESGDLEVWRDYSVVVDDHIELLSAGIEVRDASGKLRKRLKARDFLEEVAPGYALHSSRSMRVARLPGLAIGDQLSIEVKRRTTPMYFDDWLPILLDEPQKELRISISGGGENFRWKLPGVQEGIQVVETPGELRLSGENLPRRDPPSDAADLLSAGLGLVFAWDHAAEWSQVGAWYGGIAEKPLKEGGLVALKAGEISEGLISPRQKLLALASFVQLKIRYEAVEVGEGSRIPSPASDVLERGWGDCKDKSELLRHLLEAVGIKAHLVLVHHGHRGRTDPAFPATLGFNHCILAAQAEGLELLPTDPVVDGFFFLDPTMDRGKADWLNPAVQGQWALVAGVSGGLVKLPTRYREEGRRLVIEGTIDEEGELRGRARLLLVGSRALRWLRSRDSEAPERIEEAVRRTFQYLIPGTELGAIALREIGGRIPTVILEAQISRTRFLRKGRSLRLGLSFQNTLPDPRELVDRTEPIILTPGILETIWKLALPEGVCRPELPPESFSNSIGSIERRRDDDGSSMLLISRKTVTRRSWIGVESLGEFLKLATAEEKSARGSLRWKCKEGS